MHLLSVKVAWLKKYSVVIADICRRCVFSIVCLSQCYTLFKLHINGNEEIADFYSIYRDSGHIKSINLAEQRLRLRFSDSVSFFI